MNETLTPTKTEKAPRIPIVTEALFFKKPASGSKARPIPQIVALDMTATHSLLLIEPCYRAYAATHYNATGKNEAAYYTEDTVRINLPYERLNLPSPRFANPSGCTHLLPITNLKDYLRQNNITKNYGYNTYEHPYMSKETCSLQNRCYIPVVCVYATDEVDAPIFLYGLLPLREACLMMHGKAKTSDTLRILPATKRMRQAAINPLQFEFLLEARGFLMQHVFIYANALAKATYKNANSHINGAEYPVYAFKRAIRDTRDTQILSGYIYPAREKNGGTAHVLAIVDTRYDKPPRRQINCDNTSANATIADDDEEYGEIYSEVVKTEKEPPRYLVVLLRQLPGKQGTIVTMPAIQFRRQYHTNAPAFGFRYIFKNIETTRKELCTSEKR